MFSLLKPRTQRAPSIYDIPGPKGKWLIGDAMKFDADPIGWMLETKPIYGDVVRLDNETIVVHDPELIAEVCLETNKDYLLDNATVAGKKGREILLEGLKEWMQSRKYLAKALNRRILGEHINRAGVCLDREVKKLANKQIDLFDASQYILGYAIADFCLGADEDFHKVFAAVEEVFWASLDVTDSEESRLPWASRPIAKRAEKLNWELLELLGGVVRRRRENHTQGSEHRDALDQLVESLTNAPEEQLIAAVRLMMVTAHGPSGSIFSWCLLRLAENPELLEKVREELSQPENDLLAPTTYPITNAVLRETMRMHPANWLMGRTAQRDTYLGDYFIPEDCRVLFSPFVVHRDERFWQQPESFLPERWLSGEKPYTDKSYFPFGSGPRVCPGATLGPIQLMLGLKAIVTNYDLELPPLNTVEAVHSTLLRPKGTFVRWTPRD